MVGVRHASARIRCICVVANLIRIRRISRMNGLILRDRLREVIRVVRMIKPTVEVITGLVLRPCRLCRRSAVRHIVFTEDLLVCVRRVRIRRIRHHHRELLQFPLRLECIVLLHLSRRKSERYFRHSAGHRGRNFINPTLKVIAGLVACRTALSCRRCGLTRIVTVLDRLRCRRHIAALGIKAHLITRQIVGIVKDNLTARRCRREILDAALRCKGSAHACRDRIGDLVLCRVVAVVRNAVSLLLHHIAVGTGKRKGNQPRRNFLAGNRGRELVASHAEDHRVHSPRHIGRIGRTRCACRHGCIRSDGGHHKLKGRGQKRRYLRIRKRTPVSGDIFLDLECLCRGGELLPLCIELERCGSRTGLNRCTRRITLTAAVRCRIPTREEITRTRKAGIASAAAHGLCGSLIGVRIRACVIRRGIELVSVRRDRSRTVICIVFDVGVDLNRRSGLHLTAVTVVCLCRDRNRTGLLRRRAAGRRSGVLKRHDIGRLSARNAERNSRRNRIRNQARKRGCAAVYGNLKIGDGNLRCRIKSGIYIFLAVEIAIGINHQIRGHAIGLSIKRRVDRRPAVLILQHKLLVRAEGRGVCLNNPVAVVRHQNFIGTVRSAVDQEIAVRRGIQLHLRIGGRIIHAEANVLHKAVGSRIVSRVSVCLIPDKTADLHILQDIAKRKAGLPRRAEVGRGTAAHVEVTEDHILVLHTSEESLRIVKLVLNLDKRFLARIHIVNLHADHCDIRLVCRKRRRIIRCLGRRISAGARIRIRRIRNGVIQTRERRSIDTVIIQFVLIGCGLVCRTAARIAVALSLFHDRDIELPVTRVLRVIACNVYLGAEDVVVRAYISARDLGRRLIERNRGLRVGKQT